MNHKIRKEIEKAGGTLYRVGGTVRDSYLGLESKDQDFVITGIPMPDLEKLLSEFGKANLVGKSFGVIKFRPEGSQEEIDIALPRTEKSIGDGHKDFEVNFDHNLSIEEDLKRRDFTINAIAVRLDSEGETIIDPFGGVKDIENRSIHVVFPEAFEEDPLRLLRAIQFAARLKFKISQYTKSLIRDNAARIVNISGERIFEEIKKIMTRAEFPSIAFIQMRELGLLQHVMPELETCVGVTQPKKHHDQDVFKHILHALDGVLSVKLHVRLAALFHDIAKPQTRTEEDGVIHFFQHEHVAVPIIRKVLGGRWKASNDLVESVISLVKNHMFEGDFNMSRRATRRLISRVGEDLIHDLIDLRVGDRLASGKAFLSMGKVAHLREMVDEELADPAFSMTNMKFKGHHLIELGLKPGPLFGKILNRLLEEVIDDKINNEFETLKVRVIEIIAEEKGEEDEKSDNRDR